MRHRKAGVKLNRTTSHRQAMFKNMVTSLFKYDRIRTTDVKAKELRRWADHIITLAKRGDMHARRQVLAIVQEKDVVHKLFEEAGKRFGAIAGGYTRLIKIGRRPGDAAPVSIIELVAAEEKAPTKKKSKAGAKKKAAAPAAKSGEAVTQPQTGDSETKESTEVKFEASEDLPGKAAAADVDAAQEPADETMTAAADTQGAAESAKADDGDAAEEPEKK
jgi:large subunit ribosomal protein L17